LRASSATPGTPDPLAVARRTGSNARNGGRKGGRRREEKERKEKKK